MAKKKRDSGGGYNFMDTYGDLMTLLLTFFILLFSMSSVDAEKWEVLVKAFSRNKDANTTQIVMIPEGDGDDIAPAVGTDTLKSPHTTDSTATDVPLDLAQLAEMMQQYVEENEMQDSVKVEVEGTNSVYLTFDNNLFFDGDSYQLRQSSYDILDFLGGMLKSLEQEILMIRINGHTAAIPGVEDYNVNDWDLSSMRANRVATYFEERKELDPGKLMTNGWGKNRPITENETTEGRAENRRVDIQILGNDFDQGNPEELLKILEDTLGVPLTGEADTTEQDIVPPNAASDASSTAAGDQPESSASSETVTVPIQEKPAVDGNVDQAEVDAAMDALREEATKQK